MPWHPVDSTGECLRESTQYGTGGAQKVYYEEISCLYPSLRSTYMDFEYNTGYIYEVWSKMEANPWIPFLACGIYVLAIFAGQAYMKDRPAWNWRKTLAFWNLLLSVFSFVGFMRVTPQVLHNLYHYGVKNNVCESPYTLVGVGPVANWGFLFLLSKFAELFDTFFIVIHKKKLLFLHWYHHITVLYCCWHTWVNETPTGLIFCAVNFGVHAIMYFYYFLMAVRCKPKVRRGSVPSILTWFIFNDSVLCFLYWCGSFT
jgi:elongation of very long chain fatty acids protein 6